MADKLVIPMIVLAHHLKNSLQVPSMNPNYKTALKSYLGKDAVPGTFNTNILLKKGIHLHFVLPSALKKGTEVINDAGEKTFDYPAVPDRFIVTRMYVKDGKIETNCNVVESNFYSLDSSYSDSITIPKFDDLRARHRFRYMGRTYSAYAPVPAPMGESGYFNKITAVGAGDPMFSAYYPSCSSVFGFYDSLEGVPADAVLTYFVIGYYSNASNDIFSKVKTTDDMKAMLEEYNLSVQDSTSICNSYMLFGEVGGIRLLKDNPLSLGEINAGIGQSSAEALSAVIKGLYYKDSPEMERFLTSIQYDTADEAAQPDGNFKIDDDIHFRGFSRTAPIENAYSLKLPKNMQDYGQWEEAQKQYSDLICYEHEIGKLRRTLEYKRNTLYYLWEIYESSGSEREKEVMEYMNPILEEIPKMRRDIYAKIFEREEKRKVLEKELSKKDASLELTSSEPFYLAKDPAVMLFGKGMNRTYAFGEEGRFESNNTLFCLTNPTISHVSAEALLPYFRDLSHLSNIWENYKDCAVTAVLLDTANILAALELSPVIKEKYSPIMYNSDPMEQVTLLMQWESVFYPDYKGANPKQSKLVYGDTNYSYKGTMSEHGMNCSGITVLTPHGIYNLQDKLKKYLEQHSDALDAAALTEKIKDIAAVSQSLGGFNIGLTGLEYTIQFPINIDPKDAYSKRIAECIDSPNKMFYEPPSERIAVRSDMQIFPLREGFFRLSKLAVTTTFGEQRKLIDDNLAFRGKQYFSENLQPVKNESCFFPLAVTSPARLCAEFVTANDNQVISSQFPKATPVIGIFLPDMLNRNLNVFSNTGVNIGTVRTAYRTINGKKIPVGRFVKSPNAPDNIDSRIINFISALTQDNTAFAEVMETIDEKLNSTLPLSQNHFIFGRTLVLSEISVELEFFGAPEWSKKDGDLGKFDDIGLSEQEFPVMFGDKYRKTDGVCCGFYDGFSQGFAAFGAEKKNAEYLNEASFSVKSSAGSKNVTLLFDPMLKVTINTGFLPVKQLELYGEHTDFSKFTLLSSELNMVISDEMQAELPDFTGEAVFERYYPKLEDNHVTYTKLDIVKPAKAIGTIGKTMITDGIIVETE